MRTPGLEQLEHRYVLAAPVAVDDVYQVVEDELLSIDVAKGVLANDLSEDGGPLDAALATSPEHGLLTLNVDGSFTYLPEANYFGEDSFQYRAADGPLFSPLATVVINVEPSNDLPVANSDTYRGLFGQTLTVDASWGVLANDMDVDGDALNALVVDGPVHGRLSLAADGSFVYEQESRSAGSDAFSYIAGDGTETSNVARVKLLFSDDIYSTSKGVPLDIGLVNGTFETGDLTGWTTYTNPGGTLGEGFPNVVRFDTNGDGVFNQSARFLPGDGGGGISQTVWLVGGPVELTADVALRAPAAIAEGGRVELLLDGVVVATHDFGSALGSRTERDQLTATISDVSAGPHEIRVQHVRTGESVLGMTPVTYIDDIQVLGGSFFGVLSNDTGADASQLRAMLLTPPDHGELELRDDGSFRYTPDSAFVGEDTFVYKPVAPNEGVTLYSVDRRDDKLVKVNSQTGDIEVVGEIGHGLRTVDLVFKDGMLFALNQTRDETFELVTINPDTGEMIAVKPLRFSGGLEVADGITVVDGELQILFCSCRGVQRLGRVDADSGRITQLADYKQLDGGFNHNWSVLVTDINGELIAQRSEPDAIRTHRLTRSSVTHLAGIFLDDTDVDDATVAGSDHFLLHPADRAIYRLDPEMGYSEIAETIPLGSLGRVMTGLAFGLEREPKATTVTIVVPESETPGATDDAYSTDEDVAISTAVDAGLLANDAGQVQSLRAEITRGPLRGRLQANRDGSFQYTPSPDFNGVDAFHYRAVDDSGNSNIATVTITVRAVPDVPVVAPDAYVAYQERTLVVPLDAGVLANDSDGDGDVLSIRIVEDVAHGELMMQQDGSFTYRSQDDFLGVDRFTYEVSDGQSVSEIAAVTIDVGISPTPVTQPDSYAVDEDVRLVTDASILANDRDPDGDQMSAVLDSDVSHGTLQLNADGTFAYQPDADYFGSDSFTYRASDGTTVSAPQSVLITINPVNDAPVSEVDQYTVPIGAPLRVDATQGLLANDTDAEGDVLSALLVGAAQFGTVTLQNDGSFEYVSGEDFVVSDTFSYQATDGDGNSSTTAVTLLADIPMIDVGQHVLKANTAGQEIQVFVSGGQTVSGVDLFVMSGDGGPELTELGLPAGTRGPVITAVDLKSDTIFSARPDRQVDLGSFPQVANWSVSLANGGEVKADGLLVTLSIDTTGLLEGSWDLRLGDILPDHPFGPFDTSFAGVPAHVKNGTIIIRPTEVLARHIFYNDSAWDGNDAEAGVSDDDAIATNKMALLPGGTATFENYTSYSRGINGIIIDVVRLPDPLALTSDDFEFRVGRSNTPDGWSLAPSPQLFARPGAGVNGSDRITLIWPDNAIEQQWLEVRLKSGNATLLPEDDVFYFGNAIGEVGDAEGQTSVTSTDVIAARDHQRGPFDLADVTDVYDFNRDRLVSATDVIIARDNQVGPLAALPLISPSPAAGATPVLLGDVNADGVFDSTDLVRLFQIGEFEDGVVGNSTWRDGDWTGDLEFDTADLVLAFQRGHYTSRHNLASRAVGQIRGADLDFRPAATPATVERETVLETIGAITTDERQLLRRSDDHVLLDSLFQPEWEGDDSLRWLREGESGPLLDDPADRPLPDGELAPQKTMSK